jgi:hypothetical protein
MNQKIKDLMAQVGTDVSGKWMSVDHAEQFAQLIVERLCYDMMDVCGATQAERIQFVAKDWGVEL